MSPTHIGLLHATMKRRRQVTGQLLTRVVFVIGPCLLRRRNRRCWCSQSWSRSRHRGEGGELLFPARSDEIQQALAFILPRLMLTEARIVLTGQHRTRTACDAG
jgi:hypothetical protein